jgi:hypothetical protein
VEEGVNPQSESCLGDTSALRQAAMATRVCSS